MLILRARQRERANTHASVKQKAQHMTKRWNLKNIGTKT